VELGVQQVAGRDGPVGAEMECRLVVLVALAPRGSADRKNRRNSVAADERPDERRNSGNVAAQLRMAGACLAVPGVARAGSRPERLEGTHAELAEHRVGLGPHVIEETDEVLAGERTAGEGQAAVQVRVMLAEVEIADLSREWPVLWSRQPDLVVP